jgi:FlaA1/EpsC-like NDP-sugar epimerase
MVTGVAGSIGSELSWLLANFEPERLIVVAQAETPLHDLRIRMKREWGSVKCATIVTNICHSHRMERIFQDYRPEIIFHAAAYKHVPMMEDNPVESILNNVDGTKKLADLAVKFGVKQFVMISTDKAVNPTSVMGCSKRICELYCQSLNQAGISDCQFVTTRFGNVLGSNGSVIPIFREQIRRGGPVMVTHPEINRFFMLIPEACRLVLQAATIGKGGQILVFDMGQPVRILDLAKRMIELSGQRNIQIEFSGLRPGEKLYEEVLNDQETVLPTSHPKIKVARVREVDYAEACRQIEELITMARSYDAEGTVRIMKNIIPEYQTIENNEKISSTVVADPVQPVRECTEKSENREERYGEFRYSSGEGARSASLQHC